MCVTQTSIIFICKISLRLTSGQILLRTQLQAVSCLTTLLADAGSVQAPHPSSTAGLCLLMYCHQAVPKVTWEAAGFLEGREKDAAWSMRSLWLLQGGTKRSLSRPSPIGMEGQHPWAMVSPCPQRPHRSGTRCFMSVLQVRRGEVIYPRTCRKAVAELAIYSGFLALSPQFLFTASKQIQIPPEDWTSALLRDQRAEILSLYQCHQLKRSLWCLRGGPCCPLPQRLPSWWVTMVRRDLCRLTAPQ